MVRHIPLSLLFIVLLTKVRAQQENPFVGDGLLKATATISPGFLLKQPETYVYLNGDLEYFPERRVSLRGDGYFLAGAQQKPALLSVNHTLLFGALVHFPKQRFDGFLGFQPGLGFVRSNRERLPVSYPLKAVPVISLVTGAGYYVSEYFNFFVNVRYLSYRYFTDEEVSLDELRISAGLGFHILTKKE